MFDFVPLKFYTGIYHYVLFVIMLMILLHSQVYDVRDKKSLNTFHVLGIFLLLIIILYMGLRPVSGRYFADMSTYGQVYRLMQSGNVKIESDYAFNYFMLLCSKFLSVKYFFLLVQISQTNYMCIIINIIRYFNTFFYFYLFSLFLLKNIKKRRIKFS